MIKIYYFKTFDNAYETHSFIRKMWASVSPKMTLIKKKFIWYKLGYRYVFKVKF